MNSRQFPPPPEFQLEPIPGSNPVLEGKHKTACYFVLRLSFMNCRR
jgi:hypothetical protein